MAVMAAWIAPGPAPAAQTLIVTTASWEATEGRAVLVEDGRTVLGPMTVYIGHGGLGWGLGLRPALAGGPVKREGDGRSPAGVFALGPTWAWPWSRDAVCVDDPASAEYARILTPAAKPTWRSAEPMSMYRKAVLVGHNAARKPGAGSCIFLHDGHEPTVGCTAFDSADLDALVARLRPGARLVQLPEAVLRGVLDPWGLRAAPASGKM